LVMFWLFIVCDAGRWILQTMKSQNITKVGLVASNDTFGQAGCKQLAALAPEYGVTLTAPESYATTDTDLTTILTKIKGQNVQAIINWSASAAQTLVSKNMKQMGMTTPLFQSHGFGNIKFVQTSGGATDGTIFPAGQLLVADVLPADHPQKKILMEYKTDYEKQFKEDVSAFGGYAYDALLILGEAVKKADSTDRAKVRDAIENLKGVVGITGAFNFSKEDHNGLGKDAFEMLTVKDSKFVLYKK
jgi:branched-chain amino acid transport system substrate-binding protein